MIIDQKNVRELEIIARLGAENASKAMSAFLTKTVSMSVIETALRSIEYLPEALETGETLSVGILTRINGEVVGNAALLLPIDEAVKLIEDLSPRFVERRHDGESPPSVSTTFTAMERSMLEETANIAITSFMNGLASRLNKQCLPGAPVMLVDMAGAILSVILMESAEMADHALTFSSRFQVAGESARTLLVFLPSPESLAILKAGVTDE